MDKASLIKVYKFSGNTVKLYDNRVELTKSFLWLDKTDAIFLRSIASVDTPFGQRMQVKTNDGKVHNVNLTPQQARDLKERLLDLM